MPCDFSDSKNHPLVAVFPHRQRMTATFPNSTSSASTKPITFAVGTVVRVQHNSNLFKIHSHAAWSDADHQTPTFYNITGPSGQLHKMVPVERLILRADTMGEAAYAGREILALGALLGEIVPRVKHTHCWKCTTTLSHLKTKVCRSVWKTLRFARSRVRASGPRIRSREPAGKSARAPNG